MNKQKNRDPIIVIIATSFARTNLLLERSLKSVYEQININPHQIYIVDDNPIKEGRRYSDEYKNIEEVINNLRKNILKPKFDEFKNEYRAEINYDIQQNIFTLEVLRIELGKRKFQFLIQSLEDKMKIDNNFINRIITDMKTITKN